MMLNTDHMTSLQGQWKHFLDGQAKKKLACLRAADIHDYDIIIIGCGHCSSRFTGMLSLPASI